MKVGIAKHLILYVINDAEFWLSHRLELGLAAVRAGYRVAVAAPVGEGQAKIIKAGIEFYPLTKLTRWGTNPLQEISAIVELLGLYRRLRPSVVHQVTIKPVIYGSIAARLVRAPAVVNSVTGLGYPFLARGIGAGLRRWLIAAGYRVAAGHPNYRVIFQNRSDFELFIQQRWVSKGSGIEIPGSGVCGRRFIPTPQPTGVPLVILPGRFLVEKGLREFAQAAEIIKSKGVEARLAIIGASPSGNPGEVPESELQDWARRGLIEVLPFNPDMQAIYSEASIVCLPSYREGFSRALIEALASGRPIVTTDVPGCREAVEVGVNGLTVPARDPAALAQALLELLMNPRLRVQMGAASRSRFERLGLDQQKITGAVLNLYRGLIQHSEATS